MLQQQAFGMPKGQQAKVEPENGMLFFNAVSTVRGIIFHLLDEKLAKTITPETDRKAIDRLASKVFQTSIERAKWLMMTNSQRLEWLLNESQLITVVGDDEAVSLRARKSR